MKKIISVILCLVTALSAFSLVACSGKQKTLFDRAKELSAYYDKVPGTYEELLEGVEDTSNDSNNGGGAIADSTSALKGVRLTGNTDNLTPSSRPRPFEPGVIHEDAYYTVKGISDIVGTAEAWAQDAKDYFNTWSILNEWVGSSEGAWRLNYDRALDRISKESFSYTPEGDTVYMKSSLALSGVDKINYSQLYGIRKGTSHYVSRDYYLEDEYYYSIGNSLMGKTVMYIDLKSSPRCVYLATFTEEYTQKQIAYLLDDYTVSYIDDDFTRNTFGTPEHEKNCKINIYDQNGDIAFRHQNDRLYIDLWQLDGWSSLTTTGSFQGDYTLTTGTGSYSPTSELESTPLFENEALAVDFSQGFGGGYGMASVQVVSLNGEHLSYGDIVSALAQIGLSFKESKEQVYDTYMKVGYNAGAEIYPCPMFNFAGMGSGLFSVAYNSVDDAEFTSFIAEKESMSITPEHEAMNRNNDTSAGYDIVNATLTGEMEVNFEEFYIDGSLVFTAKESFVLNRFEIYDIIMAFYSGDKLFDFCSGTAEYIGRDMDKEFGTYISKLIIGDCPKGTFSLVMYMENAQGVRMTPIVFVKGDTVGSAQKDNYTITVNEDKTISVTVK